MHFISVAKNGQNRISDVIKFAYDDIKIGDARKIDTAKCLIFWVIICKKLGTTSPSDAVTIITVAYVVHVFVSSSQTIKNNDLCKKKKLQSLPKIERTSCSFNIVLMQQGKSKIGLTSIWGECTLLLKGSLARTGNFIHSHAYIVHDAKLLKSYLLTITGQLTTSFYS